MRRKFVFVYSGSHLMWSFGTRRETDNITSYFYAVICNKVYQTIHLKSYHNNQLITFISFRCIFVCREYKTLSKKVTTELLLWSFSGHYLKGSQIMDQIYQDSQVPNYLIYVEVYYYQSVSGISLSLSHHINNMEAQISTFFKWCLNFIFSILLAIFS
jgi:hypothetical protein